MEAHVPQRAQSQLQSARCVRCPTLIQSVYVVKKKQCHWALAQRAARCRRRPLMCSVGAPLHTGAPVVVVVDIDGTRNNVNATNGTLSLITQAEIRCVFMTRRVGWKDEAVRRSHSRNCECSCGNSDDADSWILLRPVRIAKPCVHGLVGKTFS